PQVRERDKPIGGPGGPEGEDARYGRFERRMLATLDATRYPGLTLEVVANPTQAGRRVHPLHQASADRPGLPAERRRVPALRGGLGLPPAGDPHLPARQPEEPDHDGPPQAAGLV